MKYLAPILVIAALLMSFTKAYPHDHSRPELNERLK